MNTDKVIRSFAEFLTISWESAHRFGKVGARKDLIDDWTQANWEMLVEATLFPSGSGFLEVYGDGADCNGASSRVFHPEAVVTHRIRCRPAAGGVLRDVGTGDRVDPERTLFWGFVNWNGATFDPEPPFNAVLLESKEGSYVVGLDDVELCCTPA